MAKATPQKQMDWMPLLLGSAFLFAFIFAAYQPALRAGFIWDDDDLVFANPLVTDAGGFRDIWFSTKFYDYYPLTLSSFWIEWRLWGNQAANYHATNILLHAFSAVFFWRCLKYLKLPGAWIVALLFAIHPVNVESVAWIAQRKNTLSLFFYALSLLFFLRSENQGSAITTQNLKFKIQNSQYWLSLFTFPLALLSKTSVVMLPVVLLGCVWWRRGKISREDFIRTIPFFILAAVLSAVTIWVQYNRAIATDVVQEGNFWARLAGAGWAIWFYLGKIFVPANLSFVYPRWTIDPRSLISFLPTLAAAVCLALFWFCRKTWGRPFLFAFGYFVVTLFPVLGFFNIYFQKFSLVADHWQYQSMIAPMALVVGGLVWISKKFSTKTTASSSLKFQPQAIVAGITIAIFLSVLTFRQAEVYANSETIWRDTLKKNPSAWIAHNLLGAEMAAQGNLDEAMTHYSAALKLNPNHAEAHNNLAIALAMRGDLKNAIEHFSDACRLNTNLLVAANSLAWIRATHPNPKFRDGAEAVQLASRAVKLAGEKDFSVLETLAAAYAEAGDFTNAEKTAQKGIDLAKIAGDQQTAAQLLSQLQNYEMRRPYRDSSINGN